jgi:hypothetical protein
MAEDIIPEGAAAPVLPVHADATPPKRRKRQTRATSERAPAHRVTDADSRAIAATLSRVALNLVAMHHLTSEAHEAPDKVDWYLVAFQEIARSNARALDAALCKLTNGPGLGNFADDLANE